MTSASDPLARAARDGCRLPARALAAALLSAAALHAPGQAGAGPKPPPPRYTFAGIPWLVPADTALARLAARGYRPAPETGDRDRIVCRGRMFDHDALVNGHLDEQRRVVRWVTLVAPRGEAYRWPDMRGVFEEISREAEARYGPPRTVSEKFRFPYQRGDGREDEALRDGLATVRRSTVAVVLTYECEEWAALEARRRAKRASDL